MYKASVVGQIELNTANAKSPAPSSSSSSTLSAAACLEPEDAELGALFFTPRLLRPLFDSVTGRPWLRIKRARDPTETTDI